MVDRRSVVWARRYLDGYRDPHPALRPLHRAAVRVAGVEVRRVPMPVPPGRRWPGRRLFWLARAHAIAAPRLRRRPGVVVVREFLTMPLVMVAARLWPMRRRLWLLVQHNLQSARTRPWERLALRLLVAWGFGFLVFEERRAWSRALGGGVPAADRLQALPHPMPGGIEPGPVAVPPVIGLVGNFRREKAPDWALERLAAAIADGRLVARLLVGSPDAAFRAAWRDRAEVIDTSAHHDYLDALRRSTVVVLPYPPAYYRYRVSGVLAEAVACGARVVVPDLPLLRAQVARPVPVGAWYRDPDDLLAAIDRALAIEAETMYKRRTAHLVYRLRQGPERAWRRLRACAHGFGEEVGT